MEIKIFGTPGEIAALATKLQERQRVQGFEIKSPYCGRDENGVFHCVCGKCGPREKVRTNKRYGC